MIAAKGARGTATGHGSSAAAGQIPVTEFPSLALPNVLPPPPPPPPPPPFPPPSPPGPPSTVGCSDGSCEGLCAHPAVRGCGASWAGATDLRKPPTGKACGGSKACAAAADACAPGWGLCMSRSAAGLDTESFLKVGTGDTAILTHPPLIP